MAKQSRQKQQLKGGLKSLLGNIEADMSKNEEVVKELSHTIAMLPINQIERNPDQPREQFDQEALDELSASIKTYGLIQPITVRRVAEGHYQIISGERRTRASQQAGLTEIPAYIRLADDQKMMEMALVENIQRENLNPMEIAVTYQRLIEEFELTHDKLSERVGKKRSTVTNYLSLINLPASIKKGLIEQHFSTGHAKAIKGIDSSSLQESLYKRAVQEKLSVRELERLVKAIKAIKEKALLSVLNYKIGDLELPTEDLMTLIQSLKKVYKPILRNQLFERISDAKDRFSIQDLADITHFLDSIEDEELKAALYEEIEEERSSIMHLAAFSEKFMSQKAKAAAKKEKVAGQKTPRLSTEYAAQEIFLKQHFETLVSLKVKEDGTGSITIPFRDTESFNEILDRIKGEE